MKYLGLYRDIWRELNCSKYYAIYSREDSDYMTFFMIGRLNMISPTDAGIDALMAIKNEYAKTDKGCYLIEIKNVPEDLFAQDEFFELSELEVKMLIIEEI